MLKNVEGIMDNSKTQLNNVIISLNIIFQNQSWFILEEVPEIIEIGMTKLTEISIF